MAEINTFHDVSFGAIVATIGSILIALGIAWLIALNWSDIPSALKILILVLATATAYTTGVILRIKDYSKIGGSLLILGALLYTLSIFLIAQIFSTSTTIQGTAFLMLLAWIGVFLTSYIFDSSPSLVIALTEFLIWISMQYLAFQESFGEKSFSIGILAIIYLAVGVLLYGMTQIHKSREHEFANVYRFWTVFYILLLTYILSFQMLLPMLWPSGFEIQTGVLFFLIIISLISIITVVTGMFMSINKGKLTNKEVVGFIALVVLYILLITLATFVSGEKVGFRGGLSLGLFFMWLFDNILFIIVIISVVGYGIRYKSAKIVNMGVIFFALDIITRYIGFILDIGGQIGFAFMSIIGGIILIFGGWGIEKWRERLIKKVKSSKQTGYSVY